MKTNLNADFLLRAVCPALALLASTPAGADEPKITDRKISIASFVDVGQVMQGSIDDGQGTKIDLKNAFLNRDGIALNYSATLNDNLHMNIGVGGLFWKAIPETQNENSKRILFGPGISEASAQYDFSPRLELKFGFFGYKYNPDAANLGEYLLKSEAYPNIIRTAGPGGWVWMNSNEYKSMGAKLTWRMMDGAVRHDFLIFSEFNETPIFDFSPSYVATASLGRNFEIGAGVSLHRFIPIRPSVTTPRGADNTYVRYDNFPEVQWHADLIVKDAAGRPIDTVYTSWRGNAQFNEAAFLAADPTRKSVEVRLTQIGSAAGSRAGTLDQMTNQLGYCESDGVADDQCSTNYLVNAKGDRALVVDPATGAVLKNAAGEDSSVGIGPSQRELLTFKGIKVMGRASLNLGGLLGMEQKLGSFKVFAEAAILGVQNQPLYYDDITQRIPIMAGADIPTFGILNRLALQIEYFRNPWPDNTYQQFQRALPHPSFPQDNIARYESEKRAGVYDEDDLKWSVYLHRELFTGLDLFGQVAHDHFRVQNVNTEPSYVPVTHSKSDWYYMLRLQWHI